MFKQLTTSKVFKELILMGFLTAFCFSLSIFRFGVTETRTFLFLNWNLFLAFIPWACTKVVFMNDRIPKRKTVVFALLILWLLFFPNAPYILTDLFHLRSVKSAPIWFDLILILSFAWTGLLFGFLSLWDIEKMMKSIINRTYISIISVALLFVCSFGIYLGRYLRWNSWDVITEPFSILHDIAIRLIHPFQHTSTWGMTLFMGLLLNAFYWSFKLVQRRELN